MVTSLVNVEVRGKKEGLWDDCKLTSYTVHGKIYCLFLSFSYHQLNERIIIFYCTFPCAYVWQNWRTRVTLSSVLKVIDSGSQGFDNVCYSIVTVHFRPTLPYISSNVCPHTYLHISSSMYHTFYFFFLPIFRYDIGFAPFPSWWYLLLAYTQEKNKTDTQ